MNKSFFVQAISLASACSIFASSYQSHHQTYASETTSTDSYGLAQEKMITPNASPVVKGGLDFFIDADFIYWTARQEGLSFALTSNIPQAAASVNNQTYPSGKNLYVNNKYSPGFKVGAGLIFDHDGWDLYCQYTWFRTHPTSSRYSGYISATPGLDNILWFSSHSPFIDDGESYRTVYSSWKLQFNEFDLELGRNYYISQKLQLRPHIGLKGGWQNQRFNTYWTLAQVTDLSSFQWDSASYTIYQKNNFWNIGPRTGLDTSWLFTKNWSIFGDFAISTLWSKFTHKRKDVATTAGSAISTDNVANFQTLNNVDRSKQLTPVMELALGLRFDWWFGDDDYRLRLQAGFENQVWFNTSKYKAMADRGFPYQERSGNLSLQGLTIEGRFDF